MEFDPSPYQGSSIYGIQAAQGQDVRGLRWWSKEWSLGDTWTVNPSALVFGFKKGQNIPPQKMWVSTIGTWSNRSHGIIFGRSRVEIELKCGRNIYCGWRDQFSHGMWKRPWIDKTPYLHAGSTPRRSVGIFRAWYDWKASSKITATLTLQVPINQFWVVHDFWRLYRWAHGRSELSSKISMTCASKSSVASKMYYCVYIYIYICNIQS